MLQPVLFLAATRFFFFNLRECFMPTDAFFLYLGSLSFFNSHPLDRVFRVSFSRLKKLRIESIPKTPARASLVVHGPAFCIVSKFFPRVSINAMAGCRLAAGFDLAPFRKNERRKSYVLPQDHGALAQ